MLLKSLAPDTNFVGAEPLTKVAARKPLASAMGRNRRPPSTTRLILNVAIGTVLLVDTDLGMMPGWQGKALLEKVGL
jgi:hypothetical protein